MPVLLGSSPQMAEWQGSQRFEELQWPTQELRALVLQQWQVRLEPAESQQRVPEQQVPEQRVPEQQVPEQQVPEQQVPPSARRDH